MSAYISVFAKEFSDMMNTRRSMTSSFSIMQIPIPNLGLITSEDFVDKENGRKAIVKGIAEPYFNKLNSTCNECEKNNRCKKDKDACSERFVEIAKGKVFQKRLAMRTESGSVYRQDKTEEVVVEDGFVAIYSPINIHLPNRVERTPGGNKIDYRPTKGYSFIRCDKTPKGLMYLYTVPKECVYPAELCSLVISLNRHSAYYKGSKIALTNGHYVNLYVVPYKNRQNKGFRIIGSKTSPNFDKEVSQLLKFWKDNEVIFDLTLTALTDNFEDNYKGKKNLGIDDYDIPANSKYDGYNYVKIKGALKDYEQEIENDNEFDS